MDRPLFDRIYDECVAPFVQDMVSFNDLIKVKNLLVCRDEIYREYQRLNSEYKQNIFDSEGELLDRHKIASCVCGAALAVPVFDTIELFNRMKDEKVKKIDSFLYFPNEFFALHLANKVLSFYLVYEHEDDIVAARRIVKEFPLAPDKLTSKSGFWKDALFNLSQVKNEREIGIENYDKYAYAMFFFWLERYYLDIVLHSSSESEN